MAIRNYCISGGIVLGWRNDTGELLVRVSPEKHSVNLRRNLKI
jgi:hypothetical protein